MFAESGNLAFCSGDCFKLANEGQLLQSVDRPVYFGILCANASEQLLIHTSKQRKLRESRALNSAILLSQAAVQCQKNAFLHDRDDKFTLSTTRSKNIKECNNKTVLIAERNNICSQVHNKRHGHRHGRISRQAEGEDPVLGLFVGPGIVLQHQPHILSNAFCHKIWLQHCNGAKSVSCPFTQVCKFLSKIILNFARESRADREGKHAAQQNVQRFSRTS